MGKTKVIYRDIAVGAAESSAITATQSTEESKPQLLAAGVDIGKVITLEHNRWLLDGTFGLTYEEITPAFWSTSLSKDDCTFDIEPEITISFSKQFSSMGVTLVFDTATGEYCSFVNLKWYQGETLKADLDFEPDSTEYFCSKRVESYDKIVLTLKKTSIPGRRAKLNHILFGITRVFERGELRDASLTNQMDEVSLELPASTFKWTLESKTDVDYLFQLRQPVEVQNDENTLGVYYIDSSDRKSARTYKISCKDALGVLDDTPFLGDAYISGVSAKSLLNTLASPFTVEYADDVPDTSLVGILEAGTKRTAIQQVLFAWGVCMATDGGETLRVFNLPSTVTQIPQSRTMTGASVSTDSVVTKVEVIAHTYALDANGSIEINNQKYVDTTASYSVSNPNLIATDKENIKKVEHATLVSPTIGQAVAQRVYDYYAKRDTISAKIVYAGEKLGDCLSIYTPWGTLLTGNLNKMEIALSNTVVYRAEANA